MNGARKQSDQEDQEMKFPMTTMASAAALALALSPAAGLSEMAAACAEQFAELFTSG
jgi:hypothetical protein